MTTVQWVYRHTIVSVSQVGCGCVSLAPCVWSWVLPAVRETNLDKDCATRSLVLGIGFSAIDGAIFLGCSLGTSTLRRMVSSSTTLFVKILVTIVGQKSYVFGSFTVVIFQFLDLTEYLAHFLFTIGHKCWFSKCMRVVVNSSQTCSPYKSIIPKKCIGLLLV